MIRALIFDFNGVIADDETPHFICFQKALAEAGLSLSADDYYGRFLGMDERTCAALLLAERVGTTDEALLQGIARRKAELFHMFTADHKPELFPGVVEFVKAAGRGFPLAIASGGRRRQIEEALAGTPIERDFEVIVAAEDCAKGKPDPAIYEMTLSRLNAGGARLPHLTPADCLVFEDSIAGIRSARRAGMRVLALATTYPADKLRDADGILLTLLGITAEIAVGMVTRNGRKG